MSEGKSATCPSCGYTKKDAQIHGDHRLCKNYGNAPWERKRADAGATKQGNTSLVPAECRFDSDSAANNPVVEGKSAATPQRGNSVVGRTIDEQRRPLVCYVCGGRFAITFNFCLEHKDEYEALKKAALGSVAAPKAQPDQQFRIALDAIVQAFLSCEDITPCPICRPNYDNRHEDACPILAAERLLNEQAACAPKAGEPPQGEEDGCDDCQYWQAQLRASEAARQITVGQLAESESKLRGAGETPAERIEEWPLCDYTRRPSLDKTQMCRCDSCQHFADVIRKLAPLPLPPGAGSTKEGK